VSLLKWGYEIAREGSTRGRVGAMSAPDASAPAPDQVFEILSSHRRRMVLYHLRQTGGETTVNDLAEQIAAWENDVEIEDLTSQQRKRVYVSLYQTHLPKLAETGMIDYDVDAGEVRITDRASDIDSFLGADDEESYPWGRHLRTFAVLLGVALGLAAVGVVVAGAGLLIWVAAGLLVGYAVTVALEYRQHRTEESTVPRELAPDDE